MTIHRTRTTSFPRTLEVLFECDACGDRFESGTEDFQSAWFDAKAQGWRAIRTGANWEHRCVSCPHEAKPDRAKLLQGVPPPIRMTKEIMRKGFAAGRKLTQEEWANPQEIAWVNELISEGVAKEIETWTYKAECQCQRRRVGPS